MKLPHCMLKLATVSGARNKNDADAEVRRVPKVAALYSQYVLRHYRNHTAQRVGPECRRAQENTDTDSCYICACQIEPLAVEDAAQHQLGDNGANNRQGGLGIALENAVGKVTHQQDAGNKKRSNVTRIETKSSFRSVDGGS